MTYRPNLFLLATVMVLQVGCAGSTSDDRSSEFTAVQAIFDAKCVSCHNPNGALTPAITYPALPLVAGRSYAALVNQPAHQACGGTLVVPGDPTNSYLHRKIGGETPCEGQHMPVGGDLIQPPQLSAADVATIAAWIAAGAPH